MDNRLNDNQMSYYERARDDLVFVCVYVNYLLPCFGNFVHPLRLKPPWYDFVPLASTSTQERILRCVWKDGYKMTRISHPSFSNVESSEKLLLQSFLFILVTLFCSLFLSVIGDLFWLIFALLLSLSLNHLRSFRLTCSSTCKHSSLFYNFHLKSKGKMQLLTVVGAIAVLSNVVSAVPQPNEKVVCLITFFLNF